MTNDQFPMTKFHRQDRLSACDHAQAGKDRKESPTLIRSEELPDRNLPNRISEFSRVSALNMGSFFADFAPACPACRVSAGRQSGAAGRCFAVKLDCSG
jgi:hypothetical protein